MGTGYFMAWATIAAFSAVGALHLDMKEKRLMIVWLSHVISTPWTMISFHLAPKRMILDKVMYVYTFEKVI